MTSQLRLGFLIFIVVIPKTHSSDDPCIKALMKSSPGQAAALSAKRDGFARPKANERVDWALEGQADKKNNEAQTERDWAGDANDFSGDWHTQAAPQFLAGAMKEMDPKTKATLMECHSRRSRQGAADKETARKNHEAAAKARESDPVEVAMANGAYNPTVRTVEQRSPLAPSTPAPAEPAPSAALEAQLAQLRTIPARP